MEIRSWGNYPQINGINFREFERQDLPEQILNSHGTIIPRGLGRSYGDSALGNNVFSSLALNRIISFDEKTGYVTCEAGVSLEDILNKFVPAGWFPSVTPGTKFITIGGAIASNVHGKNHHVAGSFCNHLYSLKILLSNGQIITCGKDQNKILFDATCGGMGLTGFILEATFKLKRIATAYISKETIRVKNLHSILDLLEKDALKWTYSVAWIDCLAKGINQGRSLLFRGEHALPQDLEKDLRLNHPLQIPTKKPISIPFYFPNFTLNNMSIKLFNSFYYHKNSGKKQIEDYDSFFYPLDNILNWNRIYGNRGFLQYQFVLPKHSSLKGLQVILTEISKSQLGAFLAVLKLFGKQNDLISFPMEGYTLAVDFPITPRLFPFLKKLDALLLDFGGKIYLTKDARMTAEMFQNSYENAEKFKKLKNKFDPQNKFQSMQSKRLKI